MRQLNSLPQYNVPLMDGGRTLKDWYFFFQALFIGLAPANPSDVTATPSPFTYSADVKGFLIVTGGTVSAIEFSRDGTTFYSLGATAGSFTLNAADQLRVTYTVAPTMTFVPT